MDDVAFEGMLTSSADATAYPRTPSLRAAVTAAIAASPAKPRRVPAHAAAFATAVVALALVLTFALPSSREAVADFFGIAGSRVEPLPTAAPGVTPTALPPPSDIDASALPSTLDNVTAALGFAPALPDGERAPRAIYLAEYAQPVAIFRYDGFDLWQTRLEGDAFVGKGTTTDATVDEFVLASGVAARWISGGDHIVQFYDAAGRAIERSQRTVSRNTLIWRTEYAFYRIETDLSRADSVAIAETLP